MGLNVSYRHFGNKAAAAKDARSERGNEGGRKRDRAGHKRPTATAT